MTVEIRPLRSDDNRAQFCSGDAALDLYFHRYAGQNQFRHHIGVTYVAASTEDILGFITVAPATLDADDLPNGRKMPPYPLPVLRVARLAVDQRARGQGLGTQLLRFAIELAEKMRDEIGCVGILVDAKPGAVEFYLRYGFVVVEALAGVLNARPTPAPMFLPLGSIPKPKS